MEHNELPKCIVFRDTDGEVVLDGFIITGAEANPTFIVNYCNNFKKAVELLKEFTSRKYICGDCETKRYTEECSACKHGIALQLLSEIEGGHNAR